MAALRYDNGTLRAPKRLPNGHLVVEGHITRIGIFEYRDAEGNVVREYRPPEEVFKQDSVESFCLVPVTNDHPTELLNAENTKRWQVGTVGEAVKRDGDHLRANMIITDAETIADIESGKAELSCGYRADIDLTPGTANGERYDAIQKNVRGNHVAIVDRARAGRSARIRLDKGDAEMIGGPVRERLMKIKINGVDVEVADDVAAHIIRERADSEARLANEKHNHDETRKAFEKQTAKLDAATETATKAEKARLDAADPKAFNARVEQRVTLLTGARAVLGDSVKLDGDDKAVRALVLAKLCPPETKLDGKSDAYLEARFDIELEKFLKTNPGLDDARRAVEGGTRNDGEQVRDDSADVEDAARKRMAKANNEAWKRKKS